MIIVSYLINHLKFFSFVLAIFLFTFSAQAQTDKIRIAFIGNSITAGVYDYGKSDIRVSYATQFSKLLEDHVEMLETYNAGVSGRTLCKNASNPIWNEAKFKDALNWKPEVCLIALGTNDSKPSTLSLVKSDFYKDYQDMIDTFREINPNITFVACLPPPIFDGHPYSANDPHNDTILLNYTIPLIDSVAKVNDIIVVDFHTPLKDSPQLFDDKLHPNREGHEKMAQILFNKFVEEGLIDVESTATSILNVKPRTQALLYPNPSNKMCTVAIPDDITGTVDITIYDSKGVMVLYLNDIKEKTSRVDVSGFSTGMYYVTIKSTTSLKMDKMLVSR